YESSLLPGRDESPFRNEGAARRFARRSRANRISLNRQRRSAQPLQVCVPYRPAGRSGQHRVSQGPAGAGRSVRVIRPPSLDMDLLDGAGPAGSACAAVLARAARGARGAVVPGNSTPEGRAGLVVEATGRNERSPFAPRAPPLWMDPLLGLA